MSDQFVFRSNDDREDTGTGNSVAIEMLTLQHEGFETEAEGGAHDAYFVKTDATTTTPGDTGDDPYVVQYNQSDFDFIL